MTTKTIKEMLDKAYESGEPVEITTEWTIYEDAVVNSCGDTMVGFVAMHPLKDVEYDFELYIASIREVRF